MEIRKEWLKGYIDLIILNVLKEHDLYGYEMTKIIKDKSDGLFSLKEGTLYPALKRLESKDMIQGYWSQNSGEAARRKYYTITKDGLIVLEEAQIEWTFLKKIINVFLEV